MSTGAVAPTSLNWAESVRLRLGRRFENPVLEPGRGQFRAVIGNESAFFDCDAPILRGGVGDYFAGVPVGGQCDADEIGKWIRLRSPYLADAVHRVTDRSGGYGFGDVDCGHRLTERRRQTHRVPLGRGVGNEVEELKELRRVQDRVGNRSRADEVFLRLLGEEVAALCGKKIGAYDG